jgi:CTP:molybdopterin cytidylyltransferase MocA
MVGDVTTVAALLAAGGGSRFTGSRHKLTVLIDGDAVVVHAARAAAAAGLAHLIVVTGAEPSVADLVCLVAPDLVVVHNPQWAEGQAISLQRAVEAAAALGADRVVVGLGDQPFVDPDAWRAVAACDAPIAVATYDGRRGNPVLLRHDVWELLPTDGDQGARVVIGMRPDLVREVPCPGSPIDIDTVKDLQRWQSSSSTNSPSTGPSTKPGR